MNKILDGEQISKVMLVCVISSVNYIKIVQFAWTPGEINTLQIPWLIRVIRGLIPLVTILEETDLLLTRGSDCSIRWGLYRVDKMLNIVTAAWIACESAHGVDENDITT